MTLRLLAPLAASLCGAAAFAAAPYTTWSSYGGAPDSMQFSALAQIDRGNVARLAPAWSYLVPDVRGDFGFNPLVVDDAMYVLGRENAIVALDAATGRVRWSHRAEAPIVTQRGISYWESSDRSERRLFYAAGSFLVALDPRTGAGVPDFGAGGRVNLRVGAPRLLGGPSATPGRVWRDLLVVGSKAGEGYGAAPGDIRAFDVRTGALVWTFHTIPRPGEFGHDTWPADAWRYAGGANVWGEISVDEARGIGYFPLGSPSFDLFGGDRKGANLFGNCLLALDLKTGKRLWHFQCVHHDLWDYDLSAAPKLLTISREGRRIDVVAQPTKFGLLFVFDRVTGEPIWPIEERPVPASDVPGEAAWPTQPFPSAPPPFARLGLGPDDLNPFVDAAERERLRAIVAAARHEGLFTPPTLGRMQISLPGDMGGSNWGGSAGNPATGWLFVRTADQPATHQLERPSAPSARPGASLAARGADVFAAYCALCHGPPEAAGIRTMDKSTLIRTPELGAERIRRVVRAGMGQMPPFDTDTLSDEQIDLLVALLAQPAAATPERARTVSYVPGAELMPGLPPPPEGVTRFTGRLGTLLLTRDGMVAIRPPWAELVAYDLNAGTIAWRAPLGTVPALAARGIRDTGNPRRVHRNGPVATAGGLIFIGNYGDATLRAFDQADGRVLWEHPLDANPEGIPAVFAVGGRQFVAFCASGFGPGADDEAPAGAWRRGSVAAQGYHVFALPTAPAPASSP
jgi:quinoprotein glucose dehydrogenase